MAIRRILCMPVGPGGVKPQTVQMIAALVKMGAIDTIGLAESHVVPARNLVWGHAVSRQYDRVLWCDSDIFADPSHLASFMTRADLAMDQKVSLAWRGAVCIRRGGGLAYHERMTGGYLLGLGLGYWHVERMRQAFIANERDPNMPFRWIPPHSEDYDASRALDGTMFTNDLDETLATSHDMIGDWPGKDPGE